MNTGEVTGVKIDKEIMVPAIIFIAVLVFAVLVFFVSKAISRKKASTAEPIVDQVKNLINPKEVTLSNAQISSLADKLFVAMKGWGTDEDAIYSVFEDVKTASDFYAVVLAFGKRKSGGFYEALPAWIADECNQREINKINNILASKNINFKF